MSLSKLGFVTLSATLCVGMALAEETPKPAETKLPPNAEVILDGKRVRTDANGNIIAGSETAVESKETAKVETTTVVTPAVTVSPEQAAAAKAAEDAARASLEKNNREVRLKAQAMVEQDARIRQAIRRLSTSGWRDAHAELVTFGKMAVPYLIEAMGSEDPSAPTVAYNLGGHSKADTGRARRQRTMAEVCTETLTEIITNHTNYKGEVPTVEQRAWQTWWAANGETVTFGK